MQSTATHGSLVADHCHTFTFQRFFYRATYRCEGQQLVWSAAVRMGRESTEELRGVTTFDGQASDAVSAVKSAVDAAIDRHAFLESDWGGLSGLSELPRTTPGSDSGAAVR